MSYTNKEIWDKVMGGNIMGLLYCSKQAVKMMESEEEGHIMNINSVVWHKMLRVEEMWFNVYAATKHAVTAIKSTLEVELLGTKIRSTICRISSGFVKTEIIEANTTTDFGTLVTNIPATESEDVTNSFVYILGTPPCFQITELTIRPLSESF